MISVNPKDLALVLPELMLVGTALVLILTARRIQKSPLAAAGTVLAALAAALAAAAALAKPSPSSEPSAIEPRPIEHWLKKCRRVACCKSICCAWLSVKSFIIRG